MHHCVSSVSVFGLFVVLLAACAPRVATQSQSPAATPGVEPPGHEAPSAGVPRNLRPGDIVEAKTGKVASFDTLMEELSHVEVIYAGETHISIEDHRMQQQILKALQATNPSTLLAMEMFPRETQPVLEAYSKGELSEAAFLKKVRWEKVWGYPFQLYSPLLTFARENRLRIIGLNAPPSVVRKIAQTGLSSLTPAERRRVAREFHLKDPKHRDYVREEFELHLRNTIKDFETFYEAQLAWEDTMAETLARLVKSPANGQGTHRQQILVLIGKGHISDQVGVPQLVSERVDYTFKTIIPIPVDETANGIDPDVGDYVWITEKSEPFHRGRMGLMIRSAKSGKGIEVTGVMPGGPAEKAGVQKNDVIYSIDGAPVNTIEDLHKAMAHETSEHTLVIRRKGREISVTVTVSPS